MTPCEVSHQVVRNKSVRYTLVKSRGKTDNIVVEVGGMLHVVFKNDQRKSGELFFEFQRKIFEWIATRVQSEQIDWYMWLSNPNKVMGK